MRIKITPYRIQALSILSYLPLAAAVVAAALVAAAVDALVAAAVDALVAALVAAAVDALVAAFVAALVAAAFVALNMPLTTPMKNHKKCNNVIAFSKANYNHLLAALYTDQAINAC